MFVIEAMKMETTVTATEEGVVESVHLSGGSLVNSDDLVVTLK
ncbi:MAG: biotin/lipoyl-containing protein [Cellulophaga baltica]